MAQLDWRTLLVGSSIAVLPGILQLMEALHPKRVGSPSTGPTKAGAAVSLAQTILTVAAASGVIDNADAQNISAIASLVQETVENMKSQGKLGGNPKPSVPVVIEIPVQQTLLKPLPVSAGSVSVIPVSPALTASQTAAKTPGSIDLSKLLAKSK